MHKDGAPMIMLTRLSGTRFLLNADLIERVESTPDTVITLLDGKKYVVSESMDSVLDEVLRFRSEIVALGALLDASRPLRPETTAPRLAAVHRLPNEHRRDER
jgi:flagellar protein FlbD